MKFKNIILLLAIFFAFNACSDDTEPVLELPSRAVFEPIGFGGLTITEDNLEETVLNLKWTAEKPSLNVATRIGIQVDKSGNEFANAKLLAETEESSYAVLGATLNDFLTKSFAQEAFTSVRYEIRIVTVVQGKDVSVIYPETASESQVLLVTTTKSSSAPEKMFMIGTSFGGWAWDSPEVVEMVPVNEQPGEFWTVKYIEAGKGFKWAPEKDWKNGFSKLEIVEGYEFDHEENAVVKTNGLYMIYIDFLKGRVNIEPAKISGMGDCFGGWDEGENLFDVSGKVATITTKNAGELRITAGSTATASDWWRREFVLKNGVIEYRGNGGDQERVNVAAGKRITLDFNTNTGTIQ